MISKIQVGDYIELKKSEFTDTLPPGWEEYLWEVGSVTMSYEAGSEIDMEIHAYPVNRETMLPTLGLGSVTVESQEALDKYFRIVSNKWQK